MIRSEDSGRDRLLRFLETDDREADCEQTLRLLHVYVELVLAGEDPELAYPAIAAHLRRCPPCLEDCDGLVAAAGSAGED